MFYTTLSKNLSTYCVVFFHTLLFDLSTHDDFHVYGTTPVRRSTNDKVSPPFLLTYHPHLTPPGGVVT